MTLTTPRRNRHDFHCHTARSDGLLEPLALYAQMRSWGLRTAALTDHDTLDGYRELRAAGLGGPEASPEAGPRLVAGVEINAVAAPGEGAGGPFGERHLLGYGIAADDPALATALARQQALRRARIDETVERLRGAGLPVDEWLPGTLGPGVTSAGRPHVARALILAGHATSLEDAFARLLGQGGPGYVPRLGLGTREAIEAITGAGGVAVLAHTVDAADRPAEIDRLVGWGLAGLEVYYGGPGHGFRPAEIDRLRAFAAARGLVATGGSDYHGDGMSYRTAMATTRVPDAAAATLLTALGERARA